MLILRLSQPSLTGVGAGAELGKMILSNIEFWRVEVDNINMHLNKQKNRDFQSFIGTFQIIYYIHSESELS